MVSAALAPAMVQYATLEFFQQLADALNQDATFQAKTSSLKAELLFSTKERADACLLKVDGGKVTVASVPADTKAEFVFLADYPTWVTNHRDGATLEKLIMTGKVKLKGSIPRIMTLKSQLGLIDAKAKTIPAEY